jgi:hypothetical protein
VSFRNRRLLALSVKKRLAAHKELQSFLFPRQDLVGAAVRGLQSSACCVLAEKDMCNVFLDACLRLEYCFLNQFYLQSVLVHSANCNVYID